MPALLDRLHGRRVLVTGAARGIGLATCVRLAHEGVAIAGIDIDAAELDVAMGALAAHDVAVASACLDVTDLGAVTAAIGLLARELGGLDGIVNVAGGGTFTGDVTQTDSDDWNDVIATNLTGIFNVCRAGIPYLREAGGGSIVNVSSSYGLVGCMGSPAYVAAKAGAIGLTRAMALDHAREGIRVTAIAPGPIATRQLAEGLEDAAGFGRPEHERIQGRMPMDRPGTPEEVAASIAFLLSSDSGFTTGTVLSLDGGWTAS